MAVMGSLMGPQAAARPLILASGSATRAAMLRAAGLAFHVDPPAVDESEIKIALKAEGADAGDCAQALAEVKAQQVARRYPQGFVIAADQMLDCNGIWFDKPPDRAHAKAQLIALSGKTHRLTSCVVLYAGAQMIWHHRAEAHLTLRDLSDSFIDSYLDLVGDAATRSVGAYQLEGPGVQMFARVHGDWFTILGLPLLPLLESLRRHEVIAP